jgi:hypothetical protein
MPVPYIQTLGDEYRVTDTRIIAAAKTLLQSI